MPIYEYACQACGAETEVLQRISDPPARKCPECGKPKLVKQVSAAGFRLAGGGWYETDFKSDRKRNLAGEKEAAKAGDDAGSKAGEGGAEKKTDAKPDASTPASKPAANKPAKPAAGKDAKKKRK